MHNSKPNPINHKNPNNKDLSKIIEDISTCPICLRLSEEAVESTCCGYIFCLNCTNKIKKKECPCCRNESFQIKPSLGMRRLIRNIPLKCKYECGFVDIEERLNEHYVVCVEREYICNIGNCMVVLKKEEFLSHLIDIHSQVMINVSECFDRLFSLKVQKKLNDNDFKGCVKEMKEMKEMKEKEIVICNGNSSRKDNFIYKPVFYDEVIEISDEDY